MHFIWENVFQILQKCTILILVACKTFWGACLHHRVLARDPSTHVSSWMGENYAGWAVKPSYRLFIKTICGKYCFIFRDIQAILPSHVYPCGNAKAEIVFFPVTIASRPRYGIYIIANWLLYNVPHELRIKWYGPSWAQTASAPYLVIPKSPQCHDASLSSYPVLLPTHVGRDISVSPSIELGVPSLYLFGNHLSTNGLARPTVYSSYFLQKPYLAMWNMLNFAVSFRGIFSNWVGTVMPYWLW